VQKKGKFVLLTFDEFAGWLAGQSVSRVIELVQVHHTWRPSYAGFAGGNHFALLEGMERAHLERGFAEIAQNLTLFPDGLVAVCRSLDRMPAGIKGANARGVCLEIIGDFDGGRDAMAQAQRDGVVGMVALLCGKFGLMPSTDAIVYHHWYDLQTGERHDGAGVTKTCPGTAFFGGNSVAAARDGFVPLIEAELVRQAGRDLGVHVTASLPKARVTAEALNLRAGPGVEFKRVAVLNKGTIVAEFENSGAWLRVAPGPRWVSSRFVERLS
jgi:hypothetical protein